jgi:hypothetical protein
LNLLLVAYFYPPCRDTGAHRPAAMAKWLRRLGHRVTVLTTSAYGTGEGPTEEGTVRTPDLQRLRARLHGHDRVDALFDSDTYSGHPHVLSRVIVPEPLVAAWAPFARRRALRLNRRERFDCVITSSPPESVHAVGRALRRRGVPGWWTSATPGPSSRSDRPFPGSSDASTMGLERRWLRSADAVVCVSRPAADDLRERLGIEPRLVPNGWDPELIAPAVLVDDGAASSTQTGSRSSTPGGSELRARSHLLVRALGELGRSISSRRRAWSWSSRA